MKVAFLDENGKSRVPTMGCYGIGIDRTLASIIEEHHDDAGILWPAGIAPYHVALIPVRYEGAMKEAADRLCAELEAAGVEVLLDDRAERPGVKFNDADLLGLPWRVVVGDRGLAENPPSVEVRRRGGGESRLVALDAAAGEIAGEFRRELLRFEPDSGV